MTVNTAKVQSRRVLRFTTLEEMLTEAQALATGSVRTLGNWSLGQILDHISVWLEFTLDGFPLTIPWYVRWVARPFRGYLVRSAMKPGFRWSEREAKLVTPQREISTEEGLAHLRRAVARWRAEPQRHPSPLLGRLSLEQWEQFQLRHAENHLGFVVPA